MLLEFAYDLLPYILILLIGLCVLYAKRHIVLFVFVLFVFSALRFDVGSDYLTYYNMIVYEEGYIERIEYLERFLISFSKSLNFPQFFFIVNSFFTLSFFYFAIKRLSLKPEWSWFVFLCFNVFYLQSMSTVRFHLALAIMFWGSTFLSDKRYMVFVGSLVLALGIHSSAIIAVLLIPLYLLRFSKKINVLLLLISFLLSPIIFALIKNISMGNAFFGVLQAYALKEDQVQAFTKLPYVFHVINICFLLFYNKLKALHPSMMTYLTIFNVSCCLMQVFSFNATLSTRLSRYFFVYILLIIPYIIVLPKYGKLFRQVIILFLVGMYLFSFFVNYRSAYIGGSKSEFLPYKVFMFS